MRIAWITDIHLDFLTDEEVDAFAARIGREAPDAVLATGDLTVASALPKHLSRLITTWRCPLYFVLGNHDYWGASISSVRRAMVAVREAEPRLRWLPNEGVVRLSEGTTLVGVDGWADFRAGNPETTPVVFRDLRRIEELAAPDRAGLIERARSLGDREAETLDRLLGEALAPSEKVVVATHIPPFAEVCRYQGHPCGPDFLPWLVCEAVGEVLLAAADAHPERELLVLAGHVHERASFRPRPNLEVRAGAARYGAPALEELLELA